MTWESSGGTGDFQITGLTADQAHKVRIRARNAIGPADEPGSDEKQATPTIGSGAQALLDAWATNNDGIAIDFSDNSMINGKGNAVTSILAGGVFKTGTPSVKWVRNSAGVMHRVPAGSLPFDHTALGVPLGILNEPVATNLFLNSFAPATQTINLPSGDITVTVWGDATVTPAGESPATEGNPVTFTSSGGNTTFTVTGAGGTFQCVNVEESAYGTSPIETGGVPVDRDPDQYEIPASAFGSWVDFQAAGTVFSRHTPYAGIALTNNRGGHFYYVEGAAAPRGIFGAFLRASDWPNYMVNNSGTTLSTGMHGTKDVENTFATSWEDPAVVNPNITITSVNGAAGSSLNGSPCVMGDASNGVLFGSGGTTANINSNFHFHGYLKELVIIPEVKSQADLNTLSAL